MSKFDNLGRGGSSAGYGRDEESYNDAKDQIIGEGASKKVQRFLNCFLPLSLKSYQSRCYRRREWAKADLTGNGRLSLSDIELWVLLTLEAAHGSAKGKRIFGSYRPAYRLAFCDTIAETDEAKTSGSSVGEDNNRECSFIVPASFRLHLAHICAYALMYDAFETIESGPKKRGGQEKKETKMCTKDVGVYKQRVSDEQWRAGFHLVSAFGLVALSKLSDEIEVMDQFSKIDTNDSGVILFYQFCHFLKREEIYANTTLGALLCINDSRNNEVVSDFATRLDPAAVGQPMECILEDDHQGSSCESDTKSSTDENGDLLLSTPTNSFGILDNAIQVMNVDWQSDESEKKINSEPLDDAKCTLDEDKEVPQDDAKFDTEENEKAVVSVSKEDLQQSTKVDEQEEDAVSLRVRALETNYEAALLRISELESLVDILRLESRLTNNNSSLLDNHVVTLLDNKNELLYQDGETYEVKGTHLLNQLDFMYNEEQEIMFDISESAEDCSFHSKEYIIEDSSALRVMGKPGTLSLLEHPNFGEASTFETLSTANDSAHVNKENIVKDPASLVTSSVEPEHASSASGDAHPLGPLYCTDETSLSNDSAGFISGTQVSQVDEGNEETADNMPKPEVDKSNEEITGSEVSVSQSEITDMEKAEVDKNEELTRSHTFAVPAPLSETAYSMRKAEVDKSIEELMKSDTTAVPAPPSETEDSMRKPKVDESNEEVIGNDTVPAPLSEIADSMRRPEVHKSNEELIGNDTTEVPAPLSEIVDTMRKPEVDKSNEETAGSHTTEVSVAENNDVLEAAGEVSNDSVQSDNGCENKQTGLGKMNIFDGDDEEEVLLVFEEEKMGNGSGHTEEPFSASPVQEITFSEHVFVSRSNETLQLSSIEIVDESVEIEDQSLNNKVDSMDVSGEIICNERKFDNDEDICDVSLGREIMIEDQSFNPKVDSMDVSSTGEIVRKEKKVDNDEDCEINLEREIMRSGTDGKIKTGDRLLDQEEMKSDIEYLRKCVGQHDDMLSFLASSAGDLEGSDALDKSNSLSAKERSEELPEFSTKDRSLGLDEEKTERLEPYFPTLVLIIGFFALCFCWCWCVTWFFMSYTCWGFVAEMDVSPAQIVLGNLIIAVVSAFIVALSFLAILLVLLIVAVVGLAVIEMTTEDELAISTQYDVSSGTFKDLFGEMKRAFSDFWNLNAVEKPRIADRGSVESTLSQYSTNKLRHISESRGPVYQNDLSVVSIAQTEVSSESLTPTSNQNRMLFRFALLLVGLLCIFINAREEYKSFESSSWENTKSSVSLHSIGGVLDHASVLLGSSDLERDATGENCGDDAKPVVEGATGKDTVVSTDAFTATKFQTENGDEERIDMVFSDGSAEKELVVEVNDREDFVVVAGESEAPNVTFYNDGEADNFDTEVKAELGVQLTDEEHSVVVTGESDVNFDNDGEAENFDAEVKAELVAEVTDEDEMVGAEVKFDEDGEADNFGYDVYAGGSNAEDSLKAEAKIKGGEQADDDGVDCVSDESVSDESVSDDSAKTDSSLMSNAFGDARVAIEGVAIAVTAETSVGAFELKIGGSGDDDGMVVCVNESFSEAAVTDISNEEKSETETKAVAGRTGAAKADLGDEAEATEEAVCESGNAESMIAGNCKVGALAGVDEVFVGALDAMGPSLDDESNEPKLSETDVCIWCRDDDATVVTAEPVTGDFSFELNAEGIDDKDGKDIVCVYETSFEEAGEFVDKDGVDLVCVDETGCEGAVAEETDEQLPDMVPGETEALELVLGNAEDDKAQNFVNEVEVVEFSRVVKLGAETESASESESDAEAEAKTAEVKHTEYKAEVVDEAVKRDGGYQDKEKVTGAVIFAGFLLTDEAAAISLTLSTGQDSETGTVQTNSTAIQQTSDSVANDGSHSIGKTTKALVRTSERRYARASIGRAGLGISRKVKALFFKDVVSFPPRYLENNEAIACTNCIAKNIAARGRFCKQFMKHA